MGNVDLGSVAINFVVFLFSLSMHECAHAIAAEYSGDPTSRYLGRITLNPMAHIDPIGTILLPLMGLLSGGRFFFFGWAKPVPFNPLNLRDRKMGEIVIAAAGPASNALLAVIAVVMMKVLFTSGMVSPDALGDMSDAVFALLKAVINWNIGLAVFNMLPIPPLDGSHILRNLLPDSLADAYSEVNPMIGFIIIFVLINLGVTRMISDPIYDMVNRFLAG